MDMQVSTGVNISSVILGALPANAEEVAAQLRRLAGVEFLPEADTGRWTLSSEGAPEAAPARHLKPIGQLRGCLRAFRGFPR